MGTVAAKITSQILIEIPNGKTKKQIIEIISGRTNTFLANNGEMTEVLHQEIDILKINGNTEGSVHINETIDYCEQCGHCTSHNDVWLCCKKSFTEGTNEYRKIRQYDRDLRFSKQECPIPSWCPYRNITNEEGI